VLTPAGARRPLAVAGALAFAAGAVVCALGDSMATLVAGRAIEGAGAAALLAPLALPRRADLTAAALPALALAAGPLVGGELAQRNWWHLYFWAGVPLAAVACAGALVAVSAERPTERVRTLGPAALAWLSAGAAFATLAFLLPQYFELVRRLSPLRGGVLTLGLILPALGGWAVARALAARLPALVAPLAGVAAAALGLVLIATIGVHTRYALIGLAVVLTGAGLGVIAGSRRGGPGEPPEGLAALSFAGAAAGLGLAGAAFLAAESSHRDGGGSFEGSIAHGLGVAALLLLAAVVAGAIGSAFAARRAAES
jgi:DHA2 family methylenomycin A resistance protein-like MFS transporter